MALPVISVHAATTICTSGSNYVCCVDRKKCEVVVVVFGERCLRGVCA
jgi:hypothetical protein